MAVDGRGQVECGGMTDRPLHGERGESHSDEEAGRNDEADGVHYVDQVDSDEEWAVFRTVRSERQDVRLVYPCPISSHNETSREANHLSRREQEGEDGELEGRVRDDEDGEIEISTLYDGGSQRGSSSGGR
jgi:hypothetical protein